MLTVYYKGQRFAEIETPYDFERIVADTIERDPLADGSAFGLDLAEVKEWKEAELRDATDEWFASNVRPFQATMVNRKLSNRNVLSVEEAAIGAKMDECYAQLGTLIAAVRGAVDWRTARDQNFPPRAARRGGR